MAVDSYTQLYMPDYYCATPSGYVAEHRYVAEQMLGRHLKPGEIVHHKDRNIKNNNPDNLMVFKTKKDHQCYHNGGKLTQLADGAYIARKEKPKRVCPQCGRVFEVRCEASPQKFCGRECALLSRRVVERPTRDQLKKLLVQLSIQSIAKTYGVSEETITDWCKQYKLPYRKADILLLADAENAKIQAKVMAKQQKEWEKIGNTMRYRQNQKVVGQ